MATPILLCKTTAALQLLRKRASTLPKDARTLLVLIDGKRQGGELRRLAIANGVQSFEQALAYLVRAGLIEELDNTAQGALSGDMSELDYCAANLITMDFTRPSFLQDNPAAGNAQYMGDTPTQPPDAGGEALARKDAAGPDMPDGRQERSI